MSCLSCGDWGERCCADKGCSTGLSCNASNICQQSKPKGPGAAYGFPCVDGSDCADGLNCVLDKVTKGTGPFFRCGCPAQLPPGGQACQLWKSADGGMGICGDASTQQSWDALTPP